MKNLIVSISAIVAAGSVWADTPPPPPETAAAPAYEQICTPLKLTLYFANDSIEVSPHARTALESAIDDVKGCAVTGIRTTTLSNDARSDAALSTISEARTDNVLEAIASTGIWSNSVQTDIVLSRSTNRADAAGEPLARRVEVELMTTRPIAS